MIAASRSWLLQGREYVFAHEEANRLSESVHHREFVLRGRKQRFDRRGQVRFDRNRGKARLHCIAHRKPARRLVEGGHLRLSPGSDINKDRNENQEWIAKEAEKAERKCQDLPERGRELRRSGVPEFHREEGMENATAVHRKSGDHVEKNQENVDGGEPCKKQDAWIFNPRQIVGLDRSDDEEEKKGDDDVHHRSRDRDREFLRRFLLACAA